MQRKRLLNSFIRNLFVTLSACFLFCLSAVVTQAQTTLPPVLLFDVVTLEATDPDGGEPNRVPPGQFRPIVLNPVVFTVTRRGPIDFDLPVHYQVSGSAENGVDYEKLPGLVVIPAGSATATITVIPWDDDLAEPTETVAILIESPICAAIFPPPKECYWVGLPNAAKAVILDNGAVTSDNFPPKVDIVKPTQGESFPSPADIAIEVQTGDADGYADFVEFFANGKKIGESRLVFIVAPKPGTILTHVFQWQGVSPGTYDLTAVAHDDRGAKGQSATVTIRVSDNRPVDIVTVEATDPDGGEPNRVPPGQLRPIILNPAVFTVTRKGPIDFDLPVYYRLEGTAENGVDYDKLPGLVVIPAGSATATITVIPWDDDLAEPTETVAILIESPICAAIFPPPKECYWVGLPNAAKAVILDNGAVTSDNFPPKVDIVKPMQGQSFSSPAEIVIEVQTGDADGYVPFVEFLANGKKIGESRLEFFVAPKPGTIILHTFQWTGVFPGFYALTAVAHDDRGATGESSSVMVRVLDDRPLPIVTIEATDPEAAEPRTPSIYEKFAPNRGRFTITRTGPTTMDLSVFMAFRGSAENGIDYAQIPEIAVIPAGAFSVDLEVLAINDQRIEKTETVEALLLQPFTLNPLDPVIPTASAQVISIPPNIPVVVSLFPSYKIGTPSSATVQLLDNGEGPPDTRPVVNIRASDDSATEPATGEPNKRLLDTGSFTITRTGANIALPMLVFFGVEGSATEEVDYRALSSSVWIPAGADSVDLSVVPLFDTLKEADESVVVRLHPSPIIDPRILTSADGAGVLPAEYYEVGSSSVAKVVIHDNDLSSENRPPKADITRPISGAVFTELATLEIEVQTVDVDGYVSFVEFFAGKELIGESRLVWIRQPDPGTVITHSFVWRNVPVGEYVLTAVAHDDRGATSTTAPVTVHVVSAVRMPKVTVVATDAEAAEPTPLPPGVGAAMRPNVAVFTVTREGGDLSLPLVVHYHMEGIARNGLDYLQLPGSVVIAENTDSADVTVQAIDDDLVEGDETVALVLDPAICRAVAKPTPGCYSVGNPGAAKAIIKDNDPNDSLPPKIHLYAIDSIATEGIPSWGSRNAVFLVHRTGRTNEAVTVGLKVTGTATSGKDYEALPESVTLPAGERRARLGVVPIDDREPERIETVRLELLAAPLTPVRALGWPAYLLARPYRAVALILDNDHRLPPSIHLPDGTFHVCIPVRAGASYEVEVSTDLKVWSSAGPANPVDDIIHYIDPDSDGSSVKFYRAVPAPSEQVQ